MPRLRTICWLLVLSSGCTGSRWARDDADYARKYAHHTDNPMRTVKQAVDARHVIGKRGAYAGFAGRDDPFGAGAEAGVFAYPRSWLEARVGGALLAHEGERPLSGGALLGFRAQPPTRLAPFVGLGGYYGWAGFEDRSIDSIDNDNDGFVDEPDEESDWATVLAVVPEAGVHYWLTSRLRLTASADYRMTTGGRDADALFYGVHLALLGRGQQSPPKQSHDDGGAWTFGNDVDAWQTAAPPNGPAPTYQPPPSAPAPPESQREFVGATLTAIGDVLNAP